MKEELSILFDNVRWTGENKFLFLTNVGKVIILRWQGYVRGRDGRTVVNVEPPVHETVASVMRSLR